MHVVELSFFEVSDTVNSKISASVIILQFSQNLQYFKFTLYQFLLVHDF